MSKGLRIFITLSVILNIVLIAAGAGMAYRQSTDKPWRHAHADLSPEARNIVGRTFQSAFAEIRPLGDEARKERAVLIEVLSAEEFDGTKFDSSVEKLTGLQKEIMDLKVAAIRDMARQLPAEERAKMAEKIARIVGGREHRVKRHRKPEGMSREEISEDR